MFWLSSHLSGTTTNDDDDDDDAGACGIFCLLKCVHNSGNVCC